MFETQKVEARQSEAREEENTADESADCGDEAGEEDVIGWVGFDLVVDVLFGLGACGFCFVVGVDGLLDEIQCVSGDVMKGIFQIEVKEAGVSELDEHGDHEWQGGEDVE